MTVGGTVNSETADYVYEVGVRGDKSGSRGEIQERSRSKNGDHMSDEHYGSRFTILEDENGAIRSLEELELDNDDTGHKSGDEGSHLQKALDGGYGWIICFGVFINQMIYGGIGRCEGLFFLQFQSKFEASAQLAAWPGSLMATLNLFMGPVCGAVVSRYSVRSAFLIGTFFVFIGMFLNGFAPNIYFLFLSHTLLRGIGRGLMSGILIMNLYFDKNRSVATGMATSGIGIGSLWVVPLTQYLFDEYGSTGAFMILAAICLHGFLAAMIFRPLSMHYRFIKSKLRKNNEKTRNTDESKALTADSNGNNENQINNTSKEIDSDMDKLSTHSDKLCIDPNSEKLSEELTSTQKELILEETKNVSGGDSELSDLPPVTTQPSNNTVVAVHEGTQPLLVNEFTDRKDQSEPSKHYEDGCCKSSLEICFPVEFKRKGAAKKKSAFHWSLLKNVPFMIYCFSNFLFILAFKTAFTFLPAIAMSKGLSKQEAALVLTISGALDTFGRMAFGFIMNLKPLRPFRPYVFNFLLFIIAAASLVIPSLTTFLSFSIVCAVYGFMTGAFIAQKMVVLIDVLGREKMPSSLGIQKVFQGFGTLIGPPFAGALRDALGNYDSSFYLGGACMIGAGMFLFISTMLLNIKNRKSKS